MKALEDAKHFIITGAAWGFGFGVGIFAAFTLGAAVLSMIERIGL